MSHRGDRSVGWSLSSDRLIADRRKRVDAISHDIEDEIRPMTESGTVSGILTTAIE